MEYLQAFYNATRIFKRKKIPEVAHPNPNNDLINVYDEEGAFIMIASEKNK